MVKVARRQGQRGCWNREDGWGRWEGPLAVVTDASGVVRKNEGRERERKRTRAMRLRWVKERQTQEGDDEGCERNGEREKSVKGRQSRC